MQLTYYIYSVCIAKGKMAEQKAQGKRHEEDIRIPAVNNNNNDNDNSALGNIVL